MRTLVVAAFLAGAFADTGVAQDGPAADIRTAIGDQFADFRAGDVTGAFEEASPFIQGMFVTPENFGLMVQKGYPMIWGARTVEFLNLREAEGRMMQRLRVRDSGGAEATYDYEMIEVDGVWRINGVYPVDDDSVGA